VKRAFQIAAAVLILVLVVGLYRAKTEAGSARARVHALQTEITETQADIRELRAETAALETPARIEALAERRNMQIGAQARALPERAIDEALPAPVAARTK
jgi:cell division protein FtsL